MPFVAQEAGRLLPERNQLLKGAILNQLTIEKIVEQIDAIHRDLAKLTVDQLQGTP
jgi:hypothetical protein